MNGDICVIIMMGEHGEQSIQSNLESYNNLDSILVDFERRKSNVFGKSNRRLETIDETLNESKEQEIREIKAKELFVNQDSLNQKNKKNNMFIPNIQENLKFDELITQNAPLSDLELKEKLFENALKDEKRSRKNPLKLLEVFIKRIQRLCNKLLKVKMNTHLIFSWKEGEK